jgi:hypothetical protein
MLGLLSELEATVNGEARTLYLPHGLSPEETESLLGKAVGMEVFPAELTELAAGSRAGAGLFWGDSFKYLVLPPFPVSEKAVFQGCIVEPLRSLLETDYRIALVLVRLGVYGVGFFQGENLVDSKVGTGLVHGRHKKGGSSQMRFQRHRDKQIESFLDRVCGHVRDKLQSHARRLDYVVYGGARTTILSLQKRCSFLQQFDDRLLPPLLDISAPRRAVLEAAVGRVYSSQVVKWQEDGTA